MSTTRQFAEKLPLHRKLVSYSFLREKRATDVHRVTVSITLHTRFADKPRFYVLVPALICSQGRKATANLLLANNLICSG